MARFIDVDKAIEVLVKRAKAEDELGLDAEPTKFAFAFIERQPEADAVEVVRCAECKKSRFNKHSEAFFCMRNERNAFFVKATDFCSWGERRKDDEV